MTVLQLSMKLMLYIVIGFAARKLKVMQDGFDKMLTRFLMSVPLPCMIINSFRIEFSVEDLVNCPIILALAVGSMAFVFVLITLCTRKMERNKGRTIRFALLFTNFTFLGLPVVSELYGARGAFTYVIFTLPIRIIFYGGAPILLGTGGEKLDVKATIRQFLCEPVVAVFIGFFLYVTQLKLPAVLDNVVVTLGNMASPLGLMLCGTVIADAKWSGVLQYPCVFVVTAIRLLVLPALIVGVFLLVGVDREIVKATMYYYAMPVASFLPTFLLRYNPEAVESRVMGGYMVVISSVLCVVTIPLWAMLLDKV